MGVSLVFKTFFPAPDGVRGRNQRKEQDGALRRGMPELRTRTDQITRIYSDYYIVSSNLFGVNTAVLNVMYLCVPPLATVALPGARPDVSFAALPQLRLLMSPTSTFS